MPKHDDYDEDDEVERPTARKVRRRSEEDDDEAPVRTKRRAVRDDDEDDAPVRSKRRAARDDDDDDEDEKPRTRRKAARDDDDDDDERPAKRRTTRARDDDDDDDERPAKRRARSRDDDDDDDDEPAPRKKAGKGLAGGWSRAKQMKDEGSSYAQTLKLTDEDQVIKFAQDEPYANFKYHWIEREGKKSFTCLQELHSKGCPLCKRADKPRSQFCFNVYLWDGEAWVNKSFDVGVQVLEQIGNFNDDKRNGPLTKMYYGVKRTGKKPRLVTNFTPIKEADLEEDWDCDPITSKVLKSLEAKLYTPEIIDVPEYQTMREIAAELDS